MPPDRSEPSAFDVVMRELGAATAPLSRIDRPERAVVFLRNLGYEFPGAADLTPAFGAAVSAVGPVRAAIDAIDAAENVEDAVVASAALLEAMQSVTRAIDGVETALARLLAGTGSFDPSTIVDLPRRLLDYLLTIHLQSSHGTLYGLLVLLGLAESHQVPADPARFQAESVRRTIY